ncbi:conjugal transfer protein TrbL family protein [Fusibacillus kribbianus]|uniref:DUF6102 family protein n=1 Tax=Fusibacillus kribbianus TaxID=3044208 RepID=A0AAP4B8X7_9FIRM|nr:conjugal transfer protein TrbL family protein [Ruminococcus sp. YH-rum2234]MDI9241919.1 DUF6102 family protein [Ruminococcus sp. YH-rum2234]
MLGWVSKQIGKFLLNLIEGMLDYFGDFLDNIFFKIADMNDNEIISSVVLFTTTLAITLLILMTIKQLFNVYLLQTVGDAESDPLDYVVKASIATALISCNGWIFSELMNFSKALSQDVTSSVDQGVTEMGKGILASIGDSLGPALLVFVILFLIIIISYFAFMVVAGIRGAELVLMKILFPIFAVDYVTETRERWSNFFSAYIICFVGYALQILCFQMFTRSFSYIEAGKFGTAVIATCGWAVLMLRAPKWLERFAYSSGLARQGGGTVRGMLRMMAFRGGRGL